MRPFYCLFILLWPAAVFSQVTISGKVLNQADDKPVAGASVFLNNTSLGCTSANDGRFAIQKVKPGAYQLVVKMVGFDPYSQAITIGNAELKLPDIALLPKTTELKQVTITYHHDPNREKYLEWFKQQFIGTSDRAQDCRILNPDMLDLSYDETSRTLTASSVDFLEIANDALGYKIKYLLKNFSFKDGEKQKVYYEGSVLFDQLEGSADQQRHWERNRLQAYQNSPMHFFRAALANRLDEENFRVQLYAIYHNPERPADSVINAKIAWYRAKKDEGRNVSDSLSYWQKKLKLPEIIKKLMPGALHKGDLVQPTEKTGEYELMGEKGSVYVSWSETHRFHIDDQVEYLYNANNNEKTLINFNQPNALFNQNGVLLNPYAVEYSGVWGRDRVAELLPVDYEPSPAGRTDTDKKTASGTVIETAGNTDSLKSRLLSLKTKSDSAGMKLTPEKLYLQFDKPYYATGDTIWFKAYVLNDYLTASAKSGILNIDVANENNKVVRRYRFPVRSGLAWGEIGIDEKYFSAGNYTLRAYTNWMRNFGDDAFFYKTFAISNPGGGQLLVNSALSIKAKNDSATVSGAFRMQTADKIPFSAQAVDLRIESNNKSYLHARALTGVDGALAVNFNLPPKAVDPVMVVENNKRERIAVIPIPNNLSQNADVQFLPEGGALVAGLSARVGFKAIGSDGRGLEVSGIVLDNDKKTVTQFKSLHNGMGSFYLDAKPGENYTAQVTLPGGQLKEYALPAVHTSGISLSVTNDMNSDSLAVTVAASEDMVRSGGNFFLIGRARSVVCYAAIINFSSGAIKRKIWKGLFPTGITHLTLMTSKYQPLSERPVFIDNHDGLKIKVAPDRSYYTRHDSVALKLKITDAEDNPVGANLSVAVTDDNQVKTAGIDPENIETRFLLSGGLKGYIEQPGYYFSSKTPETWQALDNLLLTQGWVGYKWADLLNPPSTAFQPDTEFAVTGHVTNVLNKPVKGTHILLYSKKPQMLIDTTTDMNGRFVFDRLLRADTPLFVLRALNKSGKSFNINVSVDDPAPPVFAKPAGPVTIPWYVNPDSALLNYTKNMVQLKQGQGTLAGGQMLKEVNITGKKIIKDSQNLNGAGGADFAMDERDIEASGTKTWLQLLEENVKGFEESAFNFYNPRQNWMYKYVTDFVGDSVSPAWYFINRQPVKIIVDGMEVNQLIPLKNFSDLKNYLSNSTDDIKGLEVITTSKYAGSYLARFNPYDPDKNFDLLYEADQSARTIILQDDIAFIEITTRAGHGPAISTTPGMYVYRSLPISRPTVFYKPKYKVTDANTNPDLRSIIDWEPNVVTDANGEATVWFYTADKPSTYTITVEGTDMNGHVFFKRSAVEVKATEKAK